VELLEETKGRGKEEKNDREWIMMKCITSVWKKIQRSTLKTVVQYRVGGKGQGRAMERVRLI
jgi:hypothetical protein